MPWRMAVVFAIWSATAMADPRGRVIRVERTGASSNVVPRLCEIHGDAGTCLGEQPKTGQTVIVLDEQHVVAEVQIIEATSVTKSCTNLWMVKTRAIRGVADDSDGIGVIDPAINPHRARVLDKSHLPASPSGLADEEVWRAIDRDGDGIADILITRYSCDATGKLVTSGGTSCIAVWARLGNKLTRAIQLNFAECNP